MNGYGFVIFADSLSGTLMIRFHDHGRGMFTPQHPIPPCRWDRFDLLAIHEGRMALRFDRGREVGLEAGAAAVIYPHTRFEGEPRTAECVVTVQHFEFRLRQEPSAVPLPLRRLVGKQRGFETLRMSVHDQVRADIDRALSLAYEEQTPWIHDTRVALLVLIFSRLEPQSEQAMPVIAGTWDTLDAWLRTQLGRPLTVAEIAAYVGLSSSQFAVRFRKLMGTTPAQHLHRLRMQEAMRLLRETQQPIKAVAMKLSYSDLPNFYRAFRKAVGDTPAAYRDRYKLRG